MPVRLIFCVRAVLLLALLWSGMTLPAGAQPASDSTVPASAAELAGRLDAGRSQLDAVLATMRRDTLDDAALQALRDQIDPIRMMAQDAIGALAPRVEAAKARLAQLGPKPDDKAPPETAAITADRDAQQALLNGAEDLFKRARLLAVQADQASDAVVARRRAGFLRNLLQQSRGVFAPTLWRDVASDVPREMAALRQLTEDFISRAAANLGGWRTPLFLGLLVALSGLAVLLMRIGRRILTRAPSVLDPGPLRKVLGACWSALVVATVPIAIAALLLLLGESFDLFSDRVLPLVRALVGAVTRVAIVAALARAILVPDRPSWRLVSVPDTAAERLHHLLITLAVIVSTMRVLEVLHDLIVSSVSTTVAARGAGALLVSLVIAGALYRLPNEADDNECLGPRVDGSRDWFGLIRLGGWLLALAILIAVAIGYIAFGVFLAEQLVWIATVGLAAFLALSLSVDAVDAQFRPGAVSHRVLSTTVGLRRERLGQIGILLSGGLRLISFVVAALLIAAPWGIQSDDLSGTLRAAYFGFTVGGVTLSPSSLVTAVVLFAIAVAATRAFQRWLDERFLPTTALDAGLRNSIGTVAGYVGFGVAIALALAQLGLSFDKLAIVAGALSVGIGFGLQSVVSNFVSGLILLWERAIRVGDWVVVGPDQGFVRRINVRSTEIETFDRAMMIVPNSSLVTGTVKNWVRTDRIGRLKIDVTVQHGSDPDRVRDALLDIARENDAITRLPTPTVLFTGIAASGLTFELVCFVADVETSNRAKSDLHFAMFRRFAADAIAIAPPPAGPTVLTLAQETEDVLKTAPPKAAE